MKTLKCMTRFLASVAMVLATVSSPLAQMHEEPFMKTLEDVSRTIDRLIKMSAESGDARAQFYFGRMYDSGRGVPEDDVEAARWYRMAADQGHVRAQFNLGVMYDEGEGVPGRPRRGSAVVPHGRRAGRRPSAVQSRGDVFYG